MVKDRILKPCANAFLTPIYPAYSPKNFIFALRRSVSELVLGGQSTTKFSSIVFKCEFLIFRVKFHLFFFFQKFLFLILFPKFHSQLVILVHFLVKISFLAFSSHLWFYSFTFRLRFQVVAKRFKIF